MEFLFAIFIGLILGLLGGGGSILTVPVLVYIAGIEPALATGYSLFIVGSSSMIGSAKKILNGDFDKNSFIFFGLASIISVYLTRAFLVPSLPNNIMAIGDYLLTKNILIMLVFAIFMFAASVKMIAGRKESQLTESNKFYLAISGFVTGLIAGFVGAGGGFLIVPALNQFAGLEMKKAVSTSLIIIASQSLFGFLFGDLFNQSNIDWQFLLIFTFLAVIGIFLGMNLSKKISNKGLKKIFGYFVLIMAIYILIKELI